MLPSTLAPSLAAAAAAPIASVMASGGPRSPTPHDEVSAVRAMTLAGFDEITAAWSPILKRHNLGINLSAVFCHSRPHVNFKRVPSGYAPPPPTPMGRCELSDLLLVIDYLDTASGKNDRRAVLVQAKLLKGGQIKPAGKEWVQHELLAWLPSFTFVDASYDPRPRDFNGMPSIGDQNLTAEYGGIELNAPVATWQHWLPVQNPPPFVSPISLAQYLAEMATGSSYCSREAVPGGSDDWSFTVDELLKVTAAQPIVKLDANVLRGNSNIVGFLANTGPNLSEGGDSRRPEGDGADWPEGPISTVQLTVRSLDDRDSESRLD